MAFPIPTAVSVPLTSRGTYDDENHEGVVLRLQDKRRRVWAAARAHVAEGILAAPATSPHVGQTGVTVFGGKRIQRRAERILYSY